MDRLVIIDAESRRLAEVLSAAEPASRCPTCPDWSASDLLWHLTNVHYFWAGVLSRRIRDEADLAAVEAAKPDRPDEQTALLGLREEATAALLRQLAEREDAEPCWSWWPPDQTVGFTRRMQTYEATMHRVDAELTAGLPISPIAGDVAAGAVDHAVDVMWGWMPDGATHHSGALVEFIATDADRQTFFIEPATNEKGETKEYAVEGTTPEALAAGASRTMDCIDCHNGAAHRISPTPEQAVNRAMAAGRISPSLPFVRRDAVQLLKADYPDEAAALAAIDTGLRASHQTAADQAALAQAISATQQLYRTNVFPTMKVTWGVYLDNLGHATSNGCFRCHDGSHVARDGSSISADCATCHDGP